jgi:hypothetical protein
VNVARTVQQQRFQKTKIHANAQMGAKEIKRYCAVKEDAEKLLETAINKRGLSARAYSRVLKVGRTIAFSPARRISKFHISPRRFSIAVWIGGCGRESPAGDLNHWRVRSQQRSNEDLETSILFNSINALYAKSGLVPAARFNRVLEFTNSCGNI